MRINKPLPSISRVAPGSVAILELPVGPTYERIDISITAASGLDVTDIGRINVVIDGVVRQTFKNLQRLLDLNSYYQRGDDSIGATAGRFSLHFFRREMMNNVMRLAPGMGTGDVQTVTVEMEIVSGAPATIAMSANATWENSVQPLGAFVHVKEYPWSSTVSGEVDFDKLLRGPFYMGIHLFKSDVTAVKVEKDQRIYVDASKTLLELSQKDACPQKRTPVTASATHIDFMTAGNLADAMPSAGAQDLRLKMTLGTSGSVDIVTETLDVME